LIRKHVLASQQTGVARYSRAFKKLLAHCPARYSIKLADFGESSLMPLDWDLSGSDELGFSTMTDIGKIGAVMFHIVTG
jgi:hypothetical protein